MCTLWGIEIMESGMDDPDLVMDYIQGHDLRVYAPKLHQRPPAERYEQVRRIGRAL